MESKNIIYDIQSLMKSLNEKQKAFCHQYIIDWNTTRSYKHAYGIEDDNSAAVSGFKLLRNTKIEQYIDFIKDDIEKEAGISKLKQINELHKIAYSSIAEIHDTWIDLKDWLYIKRDNPDIMAAVESIDTKTEYKSFGEGEIDVEIKFIKVKFYNKLNALDQINKMMGYNAATKTDITTKGESINNYKDLTIEELINKNDSISKDIDRSD